MKRLVSLIGKLMMISGICGYLSVIVQYIIFPKNPPEIISVIVGAFFLFAGYALLILSKRIK